MKFNKRYIENIDIYHIFDISRYKKIHIVIVSKTYDTISYLIEIMIYQNSITFRYFSIRSERYIIFSVFSPNPSLEDDSWLLCVHRVRKKIGNRISEPNQTEILKFGSVFRFGSVLKIKTFSFSVWFGRKKKAKTELYFKFNNIYLFY